MRSSDTQGLSVKAALLERIERRLPALLKRRETESLPVQLHRRRLYVLPTRFGLFFAVVFVVMQLGALNYSNNAALLFTFMLGSTAFISVNHSFRNMNTLSIASVHALPCHAGQALSVEVLGAARDGRGQRICLAVDTAQTHADAQQGRLSWRLKLPTVKRGWQSIGHLRFSTEWPLGMFHMWSWVRPDWRALIYAQPETHAPPLPLGGEQAQTQRSQVGHEDLRWIRDYQTGDAPRLIAWKASARSDRLLSRELEDPQGNQIELDWHQLGGLALELRISRLTAWVIDARRRGLRWTLRLPHDELGPASDDAHLHRCLRALALLPGTP